MIAIATRINCCKKNVVCENNTGSYDIVDFQAQMTLIVQAEVLRNTLTDHCFLVNIIIEQ